MQRIRELNQDQGTTPNPPKSHHGGGGRNHAQAARHHCDAVALEECEDHAEELPARCGKALDTAPLCEDRLCAAQWLMDLEVGAATGAGYDEK
ncbi:hypothetical protein MesoLj113b_68740 (plasmid) [Mesorhizobium sp. 113-3-3]|nr:hypothetical protein MesoLj113b_68740 [Mesorhizobium sp. 113-3-3]